MYSLDKKGSLTKARHMALIKKPRGKWICVELSLSETVLLSIESKQVPIPPQLSHLGELLLLRSAAASCFDPQLPRSSFFPF